MSTISVPRRGLQIRPRSFLFLLSLFEVHHRDLIRFGEVVDCLPIRIADLAKGGRRRNRVFSLPAQKRAYIAHSLKPGHVRLEKYYLGRALNLCGRA
jgi:hypothetical protein